jgi:8-oxo-dGTP pyrophosphatase MutT (NUDIX family)
MIREISAGGVVVRRVEDGWEMAVIEPQREPPGDEAGAIGKRKSQKVVLALPKGLVDAGEKSEETAIREVREETGLSAAPVAKLRDIKYVYVRTWGDKQRVFKIVSFFLLKYESGRIDEIDSEMRIEVRQALWIPLEGAERKLAYSGEKEVVRLAQEYLKSHFDEVDAIGAEPSRVAKKTK